MTLNIITAFGDNDAVWCSTHRCGLFISKREISEACARGHNEDLLPLFSLAPRIYRPRDDGWWNEFNICASKSVCESSYSRGARRLDRWLPVRGPRHL
jgi:hypothetical protein